MPDVMMKCGCRAQGERTMPDGSKVPVCIVHECNESMELPDLSGRVAKCAYGCGQTRPSSLELAFFEYLGPGSRESMDRCRCGYYLIAHQPRWRAEIEVDQKWYKCERAKQINTKDFHAPRGQEKEFAEREASFWRNRVGKNDKDVPVFGVEIKSIIEIKSPMKCQNFQAVGPQDDKFYCGCHGWD